MAKVLGIGGIFFRSPDPARLRDWYARWLGFPADDYGAAFMPEAMPPAARTVWSPFAADTTYFGPSSSAFMINFVVDDVDSALAQVRAGGAQQVGGVEDYDYGRFGWFVDPDGHKIELWQPKPAADAAPEQNR